MYRYAILSLFVLASCFAQGQKVNWKKIKEMQPDRILLSGERRATQVLMLGSFHFDYPNLDGHKTDSSNFIDVLSPTRQREMEELASVILRFKPTRIYIESFRQAKHDSLYQEYRKGNYKLERNEIFQVAYRVAGLMNLPKVYAVDANNFVADNFKKYSWIDSMWNSTALTDSVRDKYWNQLYDRFYSTGDSVEKHFTMLENFLLNAEPNVLRRMHGAYLTGGFNTFNSNGPDLISMWWYNRNLRIFNNILNTKPGPDDRILVLFGNGHAPILNECFNASPEFQLVTLKSLLK